MGKYRSRSARVRPYVRSCAYHHTPAPLGVVPMCPFARVNAGRGTAAAGGAR
ncbi:hypothetical protein F4561_006420 [Lipingzhangella halophila]|uniref:Uncharacterized protein n=1 Tax=Lipingzhangella halophila TaxID=1783352 RepID=A0A7W7RP32_9ACTN|nr:hypothetical protein [Lipingzhangella halophila]